MKRFRNSYLLARISSRAREARAGQTLLEAMIALFVLIVGFLGILTLLTQSYVLSRTIGNNTTATYLASEGIEIAKNMIDHDVYSHLEGVGGDPGWGYCLPKGDYKLDFSSNACPQTPVPQSQALSDPLYLDPTDNLYGYPGSLSLSATPTIFYRDVKVSVNGDQITVDSIVQWATPPAGQQTIDLEDIFYNWHP